MQCAVCGVRCAVYAPCACCACAVYERVRCAVCVVCAVCAVYGARRGGECLRLGVQLVVLVPIHRRLGRVQPALDREVRREQGQARHTRERRRDVICHQVEVGLRATVQAAAHSAGRDRVELALEVPSQAAALVPYLFVRLRREEVGLVEQAAVGLEGLAQSTLPLRCGGRHQQWRHARVHAGRHQETKAPSAAHASS